MLLDLYPILDDLTVVHVYDDPAPMPTATVTPPQPRWVPRAGDFVLADLWPGTSGPAYIDGEFVIEELAHA